jgi:hypothetical protein
VCRRLVIPRLGESVLKLFFVEVGKRYGKICDRDRYDIVAARSQELVARMMFAQSIDNTIGLSVDNTLVKMLLVVADM